MSDNLFFQLTPFIQEHIYRNGWEQLRDIQVSAIDAILNSDAHVILAAGTASGKTEAAFLPVLTHLDKRPSTSIGALYIGPTKALINDQFFRLQELLIEANIPVMAWHGDISANRKRKLLKNPKGILQITPESLESLLINRVNHLTELFHDLQFIIIDEIHIFMHSDRGRQILCQLQRLEAFMTAIPRRIGLSATLGDHQYAEQWLKGQTEQNVVTIKGTGGGKVRLSVEHFYTKEEKGDEFIPNAYEKYIFDRTQECQKTLIFANSRGGAEKAISNLRQIARRKNLPDIYHVHHGSISASLRDATEQAMNDPEQTAVTAATLTLELGVDIGQLERVIQLNAPFSVSSFLQRLGRSGRRGGPSEMWFVCNEDEPSDNRPIPEMIPWDFLQAIAILQLYIEEKWIEPIQSARYPFNLLYHQTLSILAGLGELSPAGLAQRVLSLAPFIYIGQENFRTFLKHLIELQHLELLENGKLIVGVAAENIVSNYHFYAVFEDAQEFTVVSELGEIGKITSTPPEGFSFTLAGRTWRVLTIDTQQHTIFVELISGRSETAWTGSGGEIHTRIIQKIREVLQGNSRYRYLQNGALERLSLARQFAKELNVFQDNLILLSNNRFCLFPWLGTREFNTLERVLAKITAVTNIYSQAPYFLVFDFGGRREGLLDIIQRQLQNVKNPVDLLDKDEVPSIGKFSPYIIDDLARVAFANDFLALNELKSGMALVDRL